MIVLFLQCVRDGVIMIFPYWVLQRVLHIFFETSLLQFDEKLIPFGEPFSVLENLSLARKARESFRKCVRTCL